MRLPLIVVVVTKLAEFLSLPTNAWLAAPSPPLSTISSRGKGKDGGGSTQLSQRASIASATTCSDGRAATEDGPLWDDDIPLTFIRRILCRLHGMSYHHQVSQTSSRPGTAYGGEEVSHAPFNARERRDCIGKFGTARAGRICMGWESDSFRRRRREGSRARVRGRGEICALCILSGRFGLVHEFLFLLRCKRC